MKIEDIEANMGMIIEGFQPLRPSLRIQPKSLTLYADHTSHLPSGEGQDIREAINFMMNNEFKEENEELRVIFCYSFNETIIL